MTSREVTVTATRRRNAGKVFYLSQILRKKEMISFMIFLACSCILFVSSTAHFVAENKKLIKELEHVNKNQGKLSQCNFDLLDEVESLKDKIKLLPPGQESVAIENSKSNVDKLIDKIENEMKITDITNSSYSKEYDKYFRKCKPLVVMKLDNCVEIIDLVQISENINENWTLDILYHGAPITRLTKEHQERLKKVFTEKMAEAAMNGPLPKKKMLPEKKTDEVLPLNTSQVTEVKKLQHVASKLESTYDGIYENVIYRFGDNIIKVPSDVPIDIVRDVWKEVYPDLAYAGFKKDKDGSITFYIPTDLLGIIP
jgi:hypothetical protein